MFFLEERLVLGEKIGQDTKMKFGTASTDMSTLIKIQITHPETQCDTKNRSIHLDPKKCFLTKNLAFPSLSVDMEHCT